MFQPSPAHIFLWTNKFHPFTIVVLHQKEGKGTIHGKTFIRCKTAAARDRHAGGWLRMMPNFTFGQAMTTYTGQNVGARRLDRVHQGAKQGTWDCRRHLRFPDCIDSFIRPPTDGRFYRNSRAGRFEHAHDANSRLRIYRHVHYSVSLA